MQLRLRGSKVKSYSCALGIFALALGGHSFAHSVGQTQTTKFLAPETVNFLVARAGAGTPGFQVGDTVSYIIQFTPVANGASQGVAGYVTDYIPPGTEVIDASFVSPSGGTYINSTPSLPGSIDNGWGRGRNTFTGPFATNAYDTTGLCAAAGQTNNCNGSLAQLHADTGIFYSTDPRTAAFPVLPTRIQQGTNGYFVNPTAVGQLDDLVGNPANIATTHNLWDASSTNAFGTDALPAGAPRSPQAILSSNGTGGSPFGAGSPVAGPQTGYPLDYTGAVGPWQRISYFGSRIGTRTTGPATGAATTTTEPIADPFAIKGSTTSLGAVVSPASPLPASTNAIRWAVGELVVGQIKYVKISLRLTAAPPASGIINSSEVWGGDAAGTFNGQDNPWRYHVPSVADNNSNLYVFKQVVCVYSGVTCVPGDGATIAPDARVRYRITYLNTGTVSQTNVVLTDDLPPETSANSVTNATVVSGPNILPFTPTAPASGAIITFQTIPTLVAGAGGAVEFDMQTNSGAGDTIRNQARLTSTQVPTGVTSNAVSSVVNTAFLNIAKSVTPATAQPGGTVTYTITINNSGNAAASNIVINDFLPSDGGAGGANNAPTRFNFVVGSTATTTLTSVVPVLTTPATVSPYAGTNRQQLTWTFAGQTLAVGATATISFQATVGANMPRSSTPYFNDARVAYNAGTNSVANTAPVTVPFLADMAATKTGPATVDALGNITYNIALQNIGPSPASDVTLTDSLPAGVTFVSATLGGTFNSGSNSVTWPVIASLANGVTQNYTLVVTAPANGGPLNNRVSATSTTFDPTQANNDGTAPAANVVTTITPVADLSITKTDTVPAVDTYTPGSNASYTLIVTNAGPSNVTGAVVADNLPLGVTLSGSWSCTASAGSSCSAASGGAAGGNAVNLTVNLLATGLVTITVPVNFSSDPANY
jgi:uncharacterized repeat protein (TIGR01451 family)